MLGIVILKDMVRKKFCIVDVLFHARIMKKIKERTLRKEELNLGQKKKKDFAVEVDQA